MTLTDFLLARIAEDEAAVRLATPGPWGRAIVDGQGFAVHRGEHETVALYCDRDNAAHIARHDPARVLAECEAKRHIVEVHVAYEPYSGLGIKCETCADNPEADYDGTPMIPWPCGTILALARIYAGHPDYREEWKL